MDWFVESEERICQAFRGAPTWLRLVERRFIVFSDLVQHAHSFVQIARKAAVFAHFSVFHSVFRSVFRRNCAKAASPSRMKRGSSHVKSTMVEGFPSQGPASSAKSVCCCNSRASSEGSRIGGSPLRFALVETSGPVRSSSARSHARPGTRTAAFPLGWGTTAVSGACQTARNTSRTAAPHSDN